MNTAKVKRDEVDILIRPKLSSYSRTVDDPKELRELISKGYDAAKDELPEPS
ncbi:hypothetical protein NC796_17290 [Aliifodinibius sp. S!AR15-10]|uniref:hypothetical protein n=1 Tax=Aliifodinibius sp. S!AR15-10 TaxID=2950437 RepID=UPI00286440CA|nr:hypothetical protein [Aliifodinibius sp. S!AR15-10]MDR8392914.1 hypothetical protein [Aliifodinibius sp. S!AR15-10]